MCPNWLWCPPSFFSNGVRQGVSPVIIRPEREVHQSTSLFRRGLESVELFFYARISCHSVMIYILRNKKMDKTWEKIVAHFGGYRNIQFIIQWRVFLKVVALYHSERLAECGARDKTGAVLFRGRLALSLSFLFKNTFLEYFHKNLMLLLHVHPLLGNGLVNKFPRRQILGKQSVARSRNNRTSVYSSLLGNNQRINGQVR
jgi:hypothetical protein